MNNSDSLLSIDSMTGLLIFRIMDHLLGLDIKKVETIIKPSEMDPDELVIYEKEFIIKHKNQIYFLLDLYQFIDKAQYSQTNSSRIIIINHIENTFAFFVDSIKEVLTMTPTLKDQFRITSSAISTFTSSTIQYDGEEIHIADFDKIIARSNYPVKKVN